MKVLGRVKALCAALGMLILILDSPTALSGAKEGVELCMKTVVPSLFPFFVLSSMLTGTLAGKSSGCWGRMLGIPRGSEGIFLTGLLGGYPIGARCIGDSVEQGLLEASDGARMMAFCNNAGPAFIFGMAACLFEHPWTGWALWGIQIAGALGVAFLLPGRGGLAMTEEKTAPTSLPSALESAIGAIVGVCGWVILFRVVIAFLDRWVFCFVPTEVRVTVCGLLELTNGCSILSEIANQGLRFIICSVLLSFGGLCVGMQAASVAQGVSMTWYIPGKLLQGLISAGLAMVVQALFFGDMGMIISPLVLPGWLILAGLLVFFRGKMKNKSGISDLVGV